MRRRLFRFLLALFVLSSPPPAAAGEEPRVRIRISTDAVAATLRADGGLRVLDRETRRPVGPDPFGPKAIFVAEPGEKAAAAYRAQVVSLTSEEEARKLAGELGGRLGVPARVHYHPDRRAWRVRVGAGGTPEELDPLVARLRDLGYDGVWVTLDAPEDVRGGLRAVDARWDDYPAARPALRVVPVLRGDRIRVGEGQYRGTFDILLDRRGRLTVVNELPMEQYLRGVVPNELGPSAFPEVEALKAQAVAARTYAWRNLGQFAEDGYDLCDTPRCQVYRGAGTEHSLTDRAIRETAGMVATHGGEPIHALYSSTCGGHTEDGHKQFPEEKGPYLKGVPCYPEREGAPRRTWSLGGRAPGAALVDALGEPIGRDLHLLSSLGVLDDPAWDPAAAAGPVPPADLALWLDRTLAVAGKGGGLGGPAPGSRDELAAVLVKRLGWSGRARLRVARADLDYLLDFPDAAGIAGGRRLAWALLLKDGLLRPFPDGTLRPQAAPARAEAVRMLAGLVGHYDAEGLQRGGLRAVVGGSLRVETGEGERLLPLAPDLRLIKVLREGQDPAARLEALTGDKVAFRTRPGGAGGGTVDYLEVRVNPKSASDDRFTKAYEWEQRVERQEMAARLSGSVRGIGKLVDLEAIEHGVSGRVTALRVVGSAGSQVIRGFPIRTALELPENRFTIDRQRDADGSVRAFLFTGKGWGHGVGLCQVGAYGMAMRGLNYRQILRHYYHGVRLETAYGAGTPVVDSRSAGP